MQKIAFGQADGRYEDDGANLDNGKNTDGRTADGGSRGIRFRQLWQNEDNKQLLILYVIAKLSLGWGEDDEDEDEEDE